MITYLQHGKAGDSMSTELVEHKEKLLDWQKLGLSYTRTGYGSKIPTTKMIKYLNRWHRVYCMIYSNIGTCYILKGNERIAVIEY